ncbi:hypothetical protein JTE90_003192 [Oedothorax gibbosus]|uniref:Uncharacterized protein n=1 Tax=Oedothorax gibbosus TaxID=931172 RepID=A0AAV6UR84_9ARAC|nr:hypothetical protein JTE90_003192 [Oedothorax gibbosus]
MGGIESPSSSIKASESTSLFVVLSPTLLIPTSFGIDLRLWCAGAHDVTAPSSSGTHNTERQRVLPLSSTQYCNHGPAVVRPVVVVFRGALGGMGRGSVHQRLPRPAQGPARQRGRQRSRPREGTDSPIWDP